MDYEKPQQISFTKKKENKTEIENKILKTMNEKVNISFIGEEYFLLKLSQNKMILCSYKNYQIKSFEAYIF